MDELERVGAEKDWCKEVRKRLQESKLYLKSTFRNHCQEDDSKCADHCRVTERCWWHWLSESMQSQSQREMWGSWEAEVCSWRSKRRYLYEAKNAAAKIFEWRGHILRAEDQDQYKRQIVDALKGDEAFVIVDWIMKFIAMTFQEKQAEWFAKREINWHVTSVVVRQEESLEVTWYVHLLNSCKQDWFSVLSVLENLFVTIKLRNSGIIKAFIRSDEAGCYHNSKLVSSVRELGYRQGVELVRYDPILGHRLEKICVTGICVRLKSQSGDTATKAIMLFLPKTYIPHWKRDQSGERQHQCA